jgi:hypothetical protein
VPIARRELVLFGTLALALSASALGRAAPALAQVPPLRDGGPAEAISPAELDRLQALLDDLDRAQAAGDHAGIRAAYRELFALTGWYDFLRGEAGAAAQQGQCREALSLYRRIVDEAGDPALAEGARADQGRLRGHLVVRLAQGEGGLIVDGAVMGAIPADGWRGALSPGPHDVRIEAVGRSSYEQAVEIQPCEEFVVIAALAADAPSQEPPLPEPLRESATRQRMSRAGWGLIGGGAALAGGTLLYDLAALSVRTERIRAAAAGERDTVRHLDEALDDAVRNEIILFSVAGAAAVAGIVVLLLRPEDAGSIPSASVFPTPGGGWGVGVGGTW